MSANRDALNVSYATVAWSGLQGVGAVLDGLHSRSLALVGVGVALALDVGSSCVLIWRFRQEHGHLRPEQIAGRVARIALAAVGVGLIVGGVQRLVSGSGPTVGPLPLALALAGVLVLPLLARWKLRVAARVGSGALRTDGHITAVGAVMSGVTLAGLAVTGLFSWWWADAIAGLVVAVLALRQAYLSRPEADGSGGAAEQL